MDIGSGRGDFLKGFIEWSLDGYAIDQSSTLLKYSLILNLKLLI